MQHLFVVETSSQNKSDENYIRSILKYCYLENGDKWSFEYLNGKTNFVKIRSKVACKTKKYGENTIVYVCIDLDSDSHQDKILNDRIIKYCHENKYELIWFYRDIEDVLLGKSVENSSKAKSSVQFRTGNKIKTVDLSKLAKPTDNIYKEIKTSNILYVLDKHMLKKKI